MSFIATTSKLGRRLLLLVLVAGLAGVLVWIRSDSDKVRVLETISNVEQSVTTNTPRSTQDLASLPLATSSNVAQDSSDTPRLAIAGDATTAIAVTVRHEDGRPAPHAIIQLIFRGIDQFECDEEGRALIPVQPGTYEVSLHENGFGGAISIYAPDGRSNAEVAVALGEQVEVELLVYAPAELTCLFRNHDGESQVLQSSLLYVLEDERWVKPLDGGRTMDGVGRFPGLIEGTYCLTPGEGTLAWFTPRVIELLQGERKTLEVICGKLREFTIHVETRAKPGGPLLPIWLTAEAEAIGDWTVPISARFSSARGRTLSPTRILIHPAVGPVRIRFWSTPQVGSCSQIVPNWCWPFDVEAPVEGPPEWPTFELVLDTFGELATVSGRVDGFRARKNGYYYVVKYMGPEGESHAHTLRPNQQDETFRMVVDLDLIAGRTLELFEVIGTRETLVETRLLTPGEQEWVIVARSEVTSGRSK